MRKRGRSGSRWRAMRNKKGKLLSSKSRKKNKFRLLFRNWLEYSSKPTRPWHLNLQISFYWASFQGFSLKINPKICTNLDFSLLMIWLTILAMKCFSLTGHHYLRYFSSSQIQKLVFWDRLHAMESESLLSQLQQKLWIPKPLKDGSKPCMQQFKCKKGLKKKRCMVTVETMG